VSILRSVIAIVLGYAVFAVSAGLLFRLTGRDPHAPQSAGFMLFAVVYGIAFAGVGGILASRVAQGKGTVHAAFVTLLIALGATISLVASPGAGATWSQWSALVLMAPAAWGAAAISARRRAS